MDEWEAKAWGRVRHLFHTDLAAISYLETQAGYSCSLHRHRERANLFHVVSGKLIVEQFDQPHGSESLRLTNRWRLTVGETFVVPSGVYHRFCVHEDAHVIEVYWPDRPGGKVRLDDIDRMTEGGADAFAIDPCLWNACLDATDRPQGFTGESSIQFGRYAGG